MDGIDPSGGTSEFSELMDAVARTDSRAPLDAIRRTRSVDTTARMLEWYPEDAPSLDSDEDGDDEWFRDSMSDMLEWAHNDGLEANGRDSDDVATEGPGSFTPQSVTPQRAAPHDPDSHLSSSGIQTHSMSPSESGSGGHHHRPSRDPPMEQSPISAATVISQERENAQEREPAQSRKPVPRSTTTKGDRELRAAAKKAHESRCGFSSRRSAAGRSPGAAISKQSAATKRSAASKRPAAAAAAAAKQTVHTALTAKQHDVAITRDAIVARPPAAATQITVATAHTPAYAHNQSDQVVSSSGISENNNARTNGRRHAPAQQRPDADAGTTAGTLQRSYGTNLRGRGSWARGAARGRGHYGGRQVGETRRSHNSDEPSTQAIAEGSVATPAEMPIVYFHNSTRPPAGYVQVGTTNNTPVSFGVQNTAGPRIAMPSRNDATFMQQITAGNSIGTSTGANNQNRAVQNYAPGLLNGNGANSHYPQWTQAPFAWPNSVEDSSEAQQRAVVRMPAHQRNLLDGFTNTSDVNYAPPAQRTTFQSRSIMPPIFPTLASTPDTRPTTDVSAASNETFACSRLSLEDPPTQGPNQQGQESNNANDSATAGGTPQISVHIPRLGASRAFFVGTTRASLIGMHFGTSANVWAILRKERVYFIPRLPSANASAGIWDGYNQETPNFESVGFRDIELAPHVSHAQEATLRELCKRLLTISFVHNTDLFKFN